MHFRKTSENRAKRKNTLQIEFYRNSTLVILLAAKAVLNLDTKINNNQFHSGVNTNILLRYDTSIPLCNSSNRSYRSGQSSLFPSCICTGRSCLFRAFSCLVLVVDLPERVDVLTAFSVGGLVLLGADIVDQTGFRDIEFVRPHEVFQPPVLDPAADRVAVVAGDLADDADVDHVWDKLQLFRVIATFFSLIRHRRQDADALRGGVALRPVARDDVAVGVLLAVEDKGDHILLADMVAAGLSAGHLAGDQSALQQVGGGSFPDMAADARLFQSHLIGKAFELGRFVNHADTSFPKMD